MLPSYPFVALVGQAELKDALLWLAVDPSIGGVVVTGTRGTAKSTAVRGLADLLPPIEIAAGDAFNRTPRNGEAARTIPTPFVELPVGATEDRVVGTLDVRALLTEAQRRFEPGLLARANRGALYVDEVNLLPDHLVDVLLDAAATGVNVVERDGASFTHDARIMLVGTMNPEEGELRPQLLDRFGLCVDVANDDDIERRVEILDRRIAFESDPASFVAAYAAESRALRERIIRARALLPAVRADRELLRYAARLAVEARAEGMRADLTIVRAARAIAAMEARGTVRVVDIDRAAVPSLAHRRRDAPPSKPPRRPHDPSRDVAADDGGARSDGASQRDRTFAVGSPLDPGTQHARTAEKPDGRPLGRVPARGRGDAAVPAGTLRVVRATTPRVAALETIRAAASERCERDLGSRLEIAPEHLRFFRRRGRERQLIIFLIDASGSMAAAARMQAAKGVVCALLGDAYQRRDEVALLAFRGERAQVLVHPTRSAVLAYRRLGRLATGGRTPLAEGLRRARELIETAVRRDASVRTHLVVVSDGRANYPERGAFDAALHEAAALRARGGRALCVDFERGFVRLGNARRLAAALNATYRHLDDCTERKLGATVREWMQTA